MYILFHGAHIAAEPGEVQHPPVLQCTRKFPGAFPVQLLQKE